VRDSVEGGEVGRAARYLPSLYQAHQNDNGPNAPGPLRNLHSPVTYRCATKYSHVEP